MQSWLVLQDTSAQFTDSKSSILRAQSQRKKKRTTMPMDKNPIGLQLKSLMLTKLKTMRRVARLTVSHKSQSSLRRSHPRMRDLSRGVQEVEVAGLPQRRLCQESSPCLLKRPLKLLLVVRQLLQDPHQFRISEESSQSVVVVEVDLPRIV